MALLTLFNVFIDRETFWKRSLSQVLPSSVFDAVPQLDFLSKLQLRYFGVALWIIMILFLVSSSFWRVFQHVKSSRVRLSAVSKLTVPFLLSLSPFIIPAPIRAQNLRKISVAFGVIISLLTKKMIVFSMAKMIFASIQLKAVPYLLLYVWIRYDSNITEFGVRTLLRMICVFHLHLELSWCHKAIHQICDRLDIYCLTIKHKKV